MLPLLKKSVGTQNLEVLRILVTSETLVSLAISAQFEWHYLCSTVIHKKGFDIYDQSIISNFSKNLHKTNTYV